MTKHTLLATTGASPQVVTETLYAIHHQNLQWPDDIYLITTSFGKKAAVKGLLGDGHLQRLCDELNRPMPRFDATHVLVIKVKVGNTDIEVEDARTLADHESLANFIMDEVKKRTNEPDTTLHASLAGGRKTMTFYIGYAMSLFGRPEDTLSHVLVSAGYEGPNDFYFPTQQSRPVLFTRDGTPVTDPQGNVLDAKNAKITLAPIPFVRLRDGLPTGLLAGSASFSETVAAIQKSLEPARLEIYREPGKKTPVIKCGNQSIKLPPVQLAWMIWWAERAQSKETTQAPRDKDESSNLSSDRFLQIYGNIDNPVRVTFSPSSDRQVVAEIMTHKYQSMKINLANGIYKEFFEQGISKLENSLKKQLGQYQAMHYMIQRKKSYRQTNYSLNLDPGAIFIDLE